jgi:hypothetical protein
MKDWTVMVYMAGDNNLSEDMAFSLEGLGSFAGINREQSQNGINLLAYFDGNSLTAPTFYIDYSELDQNGAPIRHAVTERDNYHSGRNAVASPPNTPVSIEAPKAPAEPINQNSASAYSVLNFIRWCVDESRQGRKAKNYILIFSGHSFGFHGESFMRDESSGKHLTITRLRWALDEANKLYLKNENNNGKLAILGFDSCVMSMLEIGHELKGVAQTLVASEGSLPNSGWGYAPMLGQFISTFAPQEKSMVTTPLYVKKAAEEFVTEFTKYHRQLLVGGRSIDISAWDLNKIVPVTREVNQLAEELNRCLDLRTKFSEGTIGDYDIAVFQDLKKIILQSHYDSQTYMHEQCVDLKDFCSRLIFESRFLTEGRFRPTFEAIIEKCGNVIEAVDKCVIRCGYSGDEYQHSNGISIYFPWTYVSYNLTDYRYRYLAFNRGENGSVETPSGEGKEWSAFLRNYLNRVSLRPARKSSDGTINEIESINKSNPPWSRSNPPWSRSNPPWSRSNPPWSRSDPPWSRSNPPWSKGGVGEYLFYFSRFKNFELRWDISGYSDESNAPVKDES